jgi:hypothetical protein
MAPIEKSLLFSEIWMDANAVQLQDPTCGGASEHWSWSAGLESSVVQVGEQ